MSSFLDRLKPRPRGANRRTIMSTEQMNRWNLMKTCLTYLGMSRTEIYLVNLEWRDLDDVRGTSRELCPALSGLDDVVKRKVQAFRYYLWAKAQCGEDPDDWEPFQSPELQSRFMAYNHDDALPLELPPLLLDNGFQMWPLWRDQVRLYLRSYRGVRGLPLSYVVRKVGRVPANNFTPAVLAGMEINEALETYCIMPHQESAAGREKFPGWEGDYTRVFDLLNLSLCEKLALPVESTEEQDDPDDPVYRPGRSFFFHLEEKAEKAHEAAIKKAAAAEGRRDADWREEIAPYFKKLKTEVVEAIVAEEDARAERMLGPATPEDLPEALAMAQEMVRGASRRTTSAEKRKRPYFALDRVH